MVHVTTCFGVRKGFIFIRCFAVHSPVNVHLVVKKKPEDSFVFCLMRFSVASVWVDRYSCVFSTKH